jgi:tetratricopeptide (TPR) repeat protein
MSLGPRLERELTYLLGVGDAAQRGAGAIVCLQGAEGAGQASVLQSAVGHLDQSKSLTVIRGRFVGDSYVPATNPSDPDSSSADLAAGILGAAGMALPVAGLLGSLISASGAAAELVGRSGASSNPVALTARLLRATAEERPTVCLVNQADEPTPGWWADTVLSLATEIEKGLPLLLLIAVTGTVTGENHPAYALLAGRGLLSIRTVPAASEDDVSAWIGPASTRVTKSLLALTEGRSEWIAELWADWRQREVVVKPTDVRPTQEDEWDFAPAVSERAVASGKDYVYRRLGELVDSAAHGSLARAHELLSLAALEGRRFTADALAGVLERDRDEVIDELDEHLAGLVFELQGQPVMHAEGETTLWIYEFQSRPDWLAFGVFGLTSEERVSAAARLADELRGLYGASDALVAPVLARLYDQAGVPEEASHYQETADIGLNVEMTLWRGDTILDETYESWGVPERARAADILILAASESIFRRPPARGVPYCDAALMLAQADSARVRALTKRAEFKLELQEVESASADAQGALELARGIGDRNAEASSHLTIAQVRRARGEQVVGDLERALDLAEQLSLRSTICYELAQTIEQSDPARACGLLQEALAIQRDTHDLQGQASSIAGLAFIAAEDDGNSARARELYEEARGIATRYGDRMREGEVRWRLVTLELGEEDEHMDYEAAVRECEQIASLEDSIGHIVGEARARRTCGLCLLLLRRPEHARSELQRASELYATAGDDESVQAVEELLALASESS